jgi:hypothetical protein
MNVTELYLGGILFGSLQEDCCLIMYLPDTVITFPWHVMCEVMNYIQ